MDVDEVDMQMTDHVIHMFKKYYNKIVMLCELMTFRKRKITIGDKT